MSTKKKMLVSPIGRKTNASRKIPARNARKNKKRLLIKIAKIRRHIKTSGSVVIVPSRKTPTTNRKRKK